MRANRYVSYLATEIEPKAFTTLSQFERATERAFQRIEQYQVRSQAAVGLGPLATAQQRTARAAAATTAATAGARAETIRANRATIEAVRGQQAFANSLTRTSDALNIVQGPLGPLAGRLSALGGVFRQLTGLPLVATTAGATAFALTSAASGYQNIVDRLRPFYETQEQTNRAMEEVIAIAGRSRQALDPIAQLYTRITQAARDAGIEQAEAGRITEIAAKAARLSGGTRQAQEAALTQFTQGFGSGILGGEELRSIREQAPRLAKAIADGLGVPIAKLKELGAEGRLTPDIIARALQRSAATIEQEFGRIGPRIDTSLTAVNNSFQVFIGNANQALGVTTKLATGIQFVADNFEEFVALLAVGAAIKLGSSLGPQLAQINANIQRNRAAQLQFNEALQAGSVTPITPAGRHAGATKLAADDAQREFEAIRANRDGLAAQIPVLDEKIARMKEASAVSREEARSISNVARFQLSEAQATTAALRQQLQARVADRIEAQAAVNDAIRARELVNQNPNLTPEIRSRYNDQEVERERKARSELTTATLRQDATLRQLTNAVEQEAVAQRAATDAVQQRVRVDNEAAATGFKAIGVAQQRILAGRELAQTETLLSAANQRSYGAALAAANAQRVYAASLLFTNRAMTVLRATGSSLFAFLGGPWGVALTGAAILMGLMATRTDEAADAAGRMQSVLDQLNAKLGVTAAQASGAAAAILELNDAKAAGKLADARDSLASTLEANAMRGSGLGGSIGAFFDEQANQVSQYASLLRTGNLNQQQIQDLTRILRERPDLNAGIGGGASARTQLVGVRTAAVESRIANADRRIEARRQQAAPAGPIVIPEARSTAQLEAAAAADAAQTQLERAQADLQRVRSERQKIVGESGESGYIAQLSAARTAVDQAREAEQAAAKAKRDGAAATRASEKAERDRARAQEQAADKARQVADIIGRYSDIPSGQAAADRDTRRIRDILNDVDTSFEASGDPLAPIFVKIRDQVALTDADVAALYRRIEEGARLPVTDMLRDQRDEIAIMQTVLDGRQAEADVLRIKQDFLRRNIDLTTGEEQELRRNLAAQEQISRAIEARNRLIDIQARSYGDVQRSIEGVLSRAPSVDSVKTLGEDLAGAYRQAFAQQVSFQLFGDAEQDFRDRMTEGLNASSDRLSTSADKLDAAAAALTSAAGAQNAIPADLDQALRNAPSLVPNQTGISSQIGEAIGVAVSEEVGDIVVTATRSAPSRSRDELLSPEARFNRIGAEFGTKIFGPNSPLTRAASKMGTFLSGATLGAGGDQLVRGVGAKGSSLGAAIGGGLAKTFGTDLAKKGLSSIAGSLGQFAGPLAGIAGGVVGSLIGGIFAPRAKTGSATISSVDGAISTRGTSQGMKEQASGTAASVQGGIQRIADALGGTTGSFGVSVGTRSGSRADKYGAYLVDPTGRGRTSGSGLLVFKTEEEAIRAAIVNALQDGAVAGVREGAQRLLQAGKDIETQLNKALQFENVFRRLKAFRDPVGAAVDDVNREFQGLIRIFKEAGASAADYADLEALYGLERAQAIEQATKSTVSQLQDFITGLTAGPESPLSRRTVYQNAGTDLDKFRADIAAGRSVDNDKLIEALNNRLDASRELFGSRTPFYSDFNDVLDLAKKAQVNLEGAATRPGTLPASPFDPAAKATLDNTLSATRDVYAAIQSGFSSLERTIVAAGGGGGYSGGSTFGLLPSAREFAMV